MERRDVLLQLAATGLAAPLSLTPARCLASGRSDLEAILASIDPELREAARFILRQDAEPLNRTTLAHYRRSGGWQPLPDVPFERRVVPGRGGRPDVPVYVVNARRGVARPAILYTHGGGFVTGSAEGSVPDLQRLCLALDCVAVSVEYRLAPETTYRGSIEDNYAGLAWLYANAADLGADPARIAVMGESAGGGHAALLAIAARDRGEVPICFQCLVYPMLDDRTGTSRNVAPQIGHVIWDRAKNRFGWESFLGTPPGARSVPGGVPARVADLAGLPPTWIGVGSADLFCDEDVDYAQRLNNAGVPTELFVAPGGFHAFDGSPADVSRRFTEAKLGALRRALKKAG